VIGCNGGGIGFCVLDICQPIGIVIAVAGTCAVEVIEICQPARLIVCVGGCLTQPVGHGL